MRATLLSYFQDIEILLTQIDSENTNIQSGVSTIFDNMPTLANSLLTTADTAISVFLATYLTTEQKELYASGDLCICEVLEYNIVNVFNSLQKIKLYTEDIIGIIKSTPKANIISYFANSDDYTLTEEQFEDDGKNKILNESTYTYYTIMEGDTPRIIANRTLGDPEKFVTIMQINNITESQLLSGEIVGLQIKIPNDVTASARGDDNLVYEANDTNLNNFLHGTDIASGVNNTILISPTGDIDGISGTQNTFNAVLKRLNNVKGTLNAFSPNWGITSIGDGNEPLLVRIDRYLTDLVNQIQADPRVASVQLDIKSLTLKGESFSCNAKVNFIGTDEQKEVEIIQ